MDPKKIKKIKDKFETKKIEKIKENSEKIKEIQSKKTR